MNSMKYESYYKNGAPNQIILSYTYKRFVCIA